MIPLPKIIQQQDAFIKAIYRTDFSWSHQHTGKVISISGNRQGFLSLANALLFYMEESDDSEFFINDIPFVEMPSGISVKIIIDPVPDNKNVENMGNITTQDEINFVWELPENNFYIVVAEILSLGLVSQIDHLHVDHGVSKDGISIYCEIDEKYEDCKR